MSENDRKKPLSGNESINSAPQKKIEIRSLTEDFEILRVPLEEIIEAEKSADELSEFKENLEDIFSADEELPEFLTESSEDDFTKEKNPVFKELSEPKLPALPKENRARLQMQSPTKLFFYWSIKNNPFQILNRVFGANAGNYTLIAKLVNQTQNREDIIPVEAEGSAWFDVDADSSYRMELGFYSAAHRPFVRLMFSNTVVTPRKNPSRRRDFSSDWDVSANQFAQVLDASGFAQDAVEVALAGDDAEFAETATRNALAQVFDRQKIDFSENEASEIRFVLLAIASGYSLENLRGQVSKNLFANLLENAEHLSAEKALNALQENFSGFADETIEEKFGQTVFGASSVNFPRFTKRKNLPKFSPLSSFNLRN